MYNKQITPRYLCDLLYQHFDVSIIRILVKEIPNMYIFESCARGEITAEEGAMLMQLRDQSNYWIVRWLRDVMNFLFLTL